MAAPASLKRFSSEKGVALIAALLLLVLTSAVAVALLMTVNTEQNLQRTDQGNNQAYYAAEAGMENMMKDLYNLYTQFQSPTVAQIQGIQANVPTQVPSATYPEYIVNVPNVGGVPTSRVQTISSGPNQGLFALITPMTLQVTADMPGQQEVRLLRSVEVAEIPVFQFGVFSESDLAFFPGPDFQVGGRVHTNGNLFVSANGGTLTFHDKVRAVGDVVRDTMQNGGGIAPLGRTTTVRFPTAPAGCDGALPACRNMSYTSPDEGSSFNGATPANGGTGTINNNWPTISLNPSPAGYNSMILNGKTGASRLTLPFVQPGVLPIEILRRPRAGEVATSPVGVSRLYNKAAIRVLLADNPAELPGGALDPQNIRLANWKPAVGPDYTNGVPVLGVPATNTVYFAEGKTGMANHLNWIAPTAEPTLVPAGAPLLTASTWNMLDGYLRVEVLIGGGYTPVTQEWLQLGFARGPLPPTAAAPNAVNPNAILILQQEADENADNTIEPGVEVTGTAATWYHGVSTTRNNWFPINFYETREGELRENQRVTTQCGIGGIVNVVEIDVNNLRKWLNGTIAGTGNQVDYTSQNGYVLYFSDHRGMLPEVNPPWVGEKRGAYGFEDTLNWAQSNPLVWGVLDPGEDLNQNGLLDTYGKGNLGLGFGVVQPGNPPSTTVNCLLTARKNRVSGARHVLRIEDGALGQVPVRLDNGLGGFTVASDNPVYVLGNYNANNAGFGNPHASAAVLADTVTFMSNGWTDLETFNSPADVTGRLATTTYYRLAIASGKTMAFQFYTSLNTQKWAGPTDFGTDGGVHNFLRYLEDWGGQTSNYMGSMVSLYYDQYATGSYKCCGTVYNPPTRVYQFDVDFQDPTKMPPGTPMFEDLVNVGFQQVF